MYPISHTQTLLRYYPTFQNAGSCKDSRACEYILFYAYCQTEQVLEVLDEHGILFSDELPNAILENIYCKAGQYLHGSFSIEWSVGMGIGLHVYAIAHIIVLQQEHIVDATRLQYEHILQTQLSIASELYR